MKVLPCRTGTFSITAAILLVAGLLLQAQTWDGGGADNNWTTAINWVGDLAPANNGTANIVFGGTTRLTPNVDVAQDILSLTFNNTAGAFTIGGSTLTIRSGGTTNNDAQQQLLNMPIVVAAAQTWQTTSGSMQFGGPSITLNANLGLNATAALNIFSPMSGSGGLTKSGTGLSGLSGANTYTGDTTINGGTLRILASERLPDSGLVIVNTGTLDLNNFTETIGRLSSSGTGFITLGTGTLVVSLNSAVTATSLGAISGSGNFTKAGTFTQIFSGANSYTGLTTVNNGVLQISASERLANTSDLLLTGGTFDLQSFNETVDVVTLAVGSIIGSGTLTGSVYNVESGTVSAHLGGTAGLNKTTAGTVTLSNANTYTGLTSVNAGTLVLGVNTTLANDTASVAVLGGATLQISSGTSQFLDGLTGLGSVVCQGANSLSVGGNNSSSSFAGVISGGGTLNKSGTGTFTLGGINTYTSGTIVGNGMLLLGGNNVLPDVNLVSVQSSGVLNVNGATDIIGALDGSGSVTLVGGSLTVGNADTSATFSGSLAGPGNLTKVGLGVQALTQSAILTAMNLNAGTLTANALAVSGSSAQAAGTVFNGALTNSGVFAMNGGLFNGTLVNYGTFNFNAGTFSARLVNHGIFNSVPVDFSAANGMANFVTLPLTSGQVYTFNGLGLDNQGAITLANATIAGNGPLVNNSSLSGYGTIGGSGGFINNALLTLSGGNLNVDNTGLNASYGNLDLGFGLQLRLNGGPLHNGGSIALNSGGIAGVAALTNGPGGTIERRGTISCPFDNAAGMLLLDSGTLNISQSFTSAGTIQLTGAAANLAGGAISNTGTIQGLGNIGNAVNNRGTVEAIGGTLNFSGSISNPTNGLMAALFGAKILASAGLADNAGVISLGGGTFDNNNKPLNNTGQVSGCGTLRSGGLANNGSITLSGGLSTVNGNVTNQATRKITVAYNPAIFTGTVVNNGTFKVTSTTATFGGTYIENGVFSSDPATNSFTDVVIGAAGYFLGQAGDLFSVSGNMQNGSLQNALWDTHDAELVFRGGPSHVFYLPAADAGTNYSGLTTNFAWKTFRLAAGESLSLQDGNGMSGAALYTRSLALEGGLAQISSITGNGFKVYYDPAASGNGYLAGGTYALAGGGAIIPLTQPVIQIVAISQLPNGSVQLDCAGVANQAHSVLASTNLAGWLPIGSATAAGNGSFSFTDTNAPNFSTRFYRLSLP